MQKKRLADVVKINTGDWHRDEIEVTVIDLEQPAHLWPRERLLVEKRERNLGDIALRITAARLTPAEDEPSRVEIEYEEGRITMGAARVHNFADAVEKFKAVLKNL